MPVTRSEGRGRKPPTEQNPTSSETTNSATGTSAEASTEESTATGTTATETSERTDTSAATDPSYETSATEATTSTAATAASAASAPPPSHPAGAVAPSVTPSATTTLTAGTKAKQLMKPPTTNTRQTETTTVKQVLRSNVGLPKTTGHQDLPPPSKKGGGGGSTHSRTKQLKLAKAKEDLLRLQVELAAARIAVLEKEDSEDEEDDVSLYSKSEANARVDNWLEHQVTRPPVLAIADQPHNPPEEPTVVHIEETRPAKHEETRQLPAGGQTDLALLAEAITRAIGATQRPKFVELPFFSGSHQEWLPFRAAYYETEAMFTSVENTNRLRRNLKGKAKEAVDGLLITNAHPAEVMKTLESRFGRPESIAMLEMETLRSLPRLTESPRDICIFATKVSNVVATLKTLGCFNYMYNPELAKTLVDKLTPTLRYRYYDFSATQPREDPCLIKIEKFFKREAELCGPYALPEQMAAPSSTAQQKKTQRVNNVTEKTQTSKCAVCDNTGHSNATECEQFEKLDANARWDMAKSKRLCFRCLRYRSKTHHCKPKPCGVDNCKYFHNKMLHYEKKTEKTEASQDKTEVVNSTWTVKKQSYLKIIPVQVKGPKGAIDTFALMDDGSTVTLVDDSVVASIGATGPIDPLKIETINDMKASESTSRRVTSNLKGLNDHEEQIQARTVKNLQVSSQRVPQVLVEGCQHLPRIFVLDYVASAQGQRRNMGSVFSQ